jgi:RNA 3'-terminal phosphate cyclase (ATP)
MSLITIDGSLGGGQILRSALALSLVTRMPFRIERIRAGRDRPGLLRQHLTALEAAAEVGRARVEGDALGSSALSFFPGRVEPGEYRFSVGTAGSTTLVLETVLPALLTAAGPSSLVLEGGTHNTAAPSFPFLERCFLPLIGRFGPRVEAVLERPGFYPAGGGRIRVSVTPAARLGRFDLLERGPVKRRRARALVSRLPASIGERELGVVRERLGWEERELGVEVIRDSPGPGNVLVLEIESEPVTEVITGFGERGVPAEKVAARAVEEAERYLTSGVPAGEHLADQLLLPLALAGGGSFRTLQPSSHTLTNIEVLQMFLPVEVRLEEEAPDRFRIEVLRRT